VCVVWGGPNYIHILDSEVSSMPVRVTLGLTVSQSACLGVEPRLGLMTRYFVTV
jgi:hypothetical protein